MNQFDWIETDCSDEDTKRILRAAVEHYKRWKIPGEAHCEICGLIERKLLYEKR